MRTSYNFVALEHDDFLAGAPLGFDVYDLGGAALLPAGTTLHDPAQPAFLFDHFQPARRDAAGLGVAGLAQQPARRNRRKTACRRSRTWAFGWARRSACGGGSARRARCCAAG
ncbi:hypothetical protein [Burkholderia ubonensis]|uniref:hypothetical protein n=1 Tax=Burkholderia ubonensis TaxID=101571 RepID=UPI000B0F8F77